MIAQTCILVMAMLVVGIGFHPAVAMKSVRYALARVDARIAP
jgi:hypothetical protein